MAKDRRAREQGRLTVAALGNMVAALVDTMRDVGVPREVIHAFLDRLDALNAMTLYGFPGDIMSDLVDVVRDSVPAND